MITKLTKSQFVYTLPKHKKTDTKLLRISPEIRELIKKVNQENNETAFIDKAIIEYLFRNGLRLIIEDSKQSFRIEAPKPYVNKHCQHCWFVKNW